MLPCSALAGSVGFERLLIPQPGGGSLPGGEWYPTKSPTTFTRLGFTRQTVAENDVVDGSHLPIVVMSHAALGDWSSSADTAVALASAGFVVAALTHREFDTHGELELAARSQQFIALLEFVSHDWPGRYHIDTQRVGAFGVSVGGFTVLVAAGGTPAASSVGPHCRVAPGDWACKIAAAKGIDIARSPQAALQWQHAPEIRAGVVAAPALGFLFGK